jgi:hypothetical protein
MLTGRKIFFYMYPYAAVQEMSVDCILLKQRNRPTHEEEASDAVLTDPNLNSLGHTQKGFFYTVHFGTYCIMCRCTLFVYDLRAMLISSSLQIQPIVSIKIYI